MVQPANVIGSLPQLAWRDLDPVPCSDASYEFSHEQVARKYPYVDVFGHEWTGRNSIVMNCKLRFHNTVQPNLYPTLWEDYRSALFDGSAATLNHPDLGEIQARVLKGSVKLVAESRDGVDVDVTFEETRDDPDKAQDEINDLAIGLEPAAAAADVALGGLLLGYPKIVYPPVTSILGFIQTIQGDIFSAELSVSGLINQAIDYVRQIANSVASLNPESGQIRSPFVTVTALWNLDLVEDGLVQLLDNFQKSQRPISSQILANDSTLSGFAQSVGNTITDVLDLNPTSLGTPRVPKGTTLRYYKGS